MAPPTHPNHPLAPATSGRHSSADRRLKNLAERIDPRKIQGSQGLPIVAIVDSGRSYEVVLSTEARGSCRRYGKRPNGRALPTPPWTAQRPPPTGSTGPSPWVSAWTMIAPVRQHSPRRAPSNRRFAPTSDHHRPESMITIPVSAITITGISSSTAHHALALCLGDA